MRASGCGVVVLTSRRRACTNEEVLSSARSDFEVLRRAAGRKGDDVPVKRRKLDACAYARAKSDADNADVIILDARLILDPRHRLALPEKAVVLFDDAVDVEGLARQLASVRVDDASGFAAGDTVVVERAPSAEWIASIGMDAIADCDDGGGCYDWDPADLEN